MTEIVFAPLDSPSGTIAGSGTAVLVAAAAALRAYDVDSVAVLGAAAPTLYAFDGGPRVTMVAAPAVLIASDATSVAVLVAQAPGIVASDGAVQIPSLAVAVLVAQAPGIDVHSKQRLFADFDVLAQRPTMLATDASSIAILRARAPTMYAEDERPLVNFAYLVMSPGHLEITSGAFLEELSDGLALGSAVRGDAIFALMDTLRMGAAAGGTLRAGESMSDSFGMGDLLGVIWTALASDTISLGDTLNESTRAVADMVDTLRLVAGANSTLSAIVAVASALGLRDGIGITTLESLSDGLGLGADVESTIRAYERMVDQLLLQAVASEHAVLSALVSDTLALNDTNATTAALIEQLQDGLGLSVTLRLADTTYFAWVCNTQTRAFTSYSNFPFNSFAQVGRKYFAAADDGIYELTGDTDDGEPIQARVRTALTNLGTGREKRMPALYLGYRSQGPLVLKAVTTSPTGEKREDWYQLTPRTADVAREGRIKLGKGLKSVFWGFELTSIDGASFAIDDLKLFPMICDRRIAGA